MTAVETIVALLDFVNSFDAASAPQVAIPIADDLNIDLAQAQSAFADPDEAFDKLIAGTPVVKDVLAEMSGAGWNIKSSIDEIAKEDRGAEFTFPALEKPSLLLQMLFGKDVDLAVFDAGTLRAENGFDYFYGLPFAKVGIRGSASVEGHLALSYDTAGIRRTIASKPLTWSSLGALVHGFGINDLDADGNDVPEIRLDASLSLYAYAGVPGANVTAEGGVEGFLQADLIDPDKDGKVRYDEIKKRITNPRCLFDTTGQIQAFARVKGQLGPFSGTKDIVKPYVLWEFSSIESWCRQMEQGGGGSGMPIPPPVLAEVNPNDFHELNINVGTRANRRNLGGSPDETGRRLPRRRTRCRQHVRTANNYGAIDKKITTVRLPRHGYYITVFGPGDPYEYALHRGRAGDPTKPPRPAMWPTRCWVRPATTSLSGAGTTSSSPVTATKIVTLEAAGVDTIHGDTAGATGAGDDVIDGGDGDDRYPMHGRDSVFGRSRQRLHRRDVTLTTGIAS